MFFLIISCSKIELETYRQHCEICDEKDPETKKDLYVDELTGKCIDTCQGNGRFIMNKTYKNITYKTCEFCMDIHCSKCQPTNTENCTECLPGYEVDQETRICIEKKPISPAFIYLIVVAIIVAVIILSILAYSFLLNHSYKDLNQSQQYDLKRKKSRVMKKLKGFVFTNRRMMSIKRKTVNLFRKSVQDLDGLDNELGGNKIGRVESPEMPREGVHANVMKNYKIMVNTIPSKSQTESQPSADRRDDLISQNGEHSVGRISEMSSRLEEDDHMDFGSEGVKNKAYHLFKMKSDSKTFLNESIDERRKGYMNKTSSLDVQPTPMNAHEVTRNSALSSGDSEEEKEGSSSGQHSHRLHH